MQKATNGNTKGGILQTGMPPDAQNSILSGTYFLFCLKIHTKAKYHYERHKPQYAYTYQYSNVPIINQHLPKNGIPSIHTETQTEACSI